MLFTVTEDALTNALFYDTKLAAEGGGSKAEARQQARVMLAGEKLLAACELALRSIENSTPHPGYGAARQADQSIIRAAIADGRPNRPLFSVKTETVGEG